MQDEYDHAGERICDTAMNYGYDSCMNKKVEEIIANQFNCSVPYVPPSAR